MMHASRTSLAVATASRNRLGLVSTDAGPARQSAMLTGWKEIGNFVGRGVRTVQRWQAELELPVHRVRNSPRSPVFAFKSELDWWMRARAMNNPSTHPLVPREHQTNFAIQEAHLLKTRCRSLNIDLHQQVQSLIHNLDALRRLTDTSPCLPSTRDSEYQILDSKAPRNSPSKVILSARKWPDVPTSM
ncbi:MAG TPA: hypothetical protein VF011_06610 [Terriglobales bacterium]